MYTKKREPFHQRAVNFYDKGDQGKRRESAVKFDINTGSQLTGPGTHDYIHFQGKRNRNVLPSARFTLCRRDTARFSAGLLYFAEGRPGHFGRFIYSGYKVHKICFSRGSSKDVKGGCSYQSGPLVTIVRFWLIYAMKMSTGGTEGYTISKQFLRVARLILCHVGKWWSAVKVRNRSCITTYAGTKQRLISPVQSATPVALIFVKPTCASHLPHNAPILSEHDPLSPTLKGFIFIASLFCFFLDIHRADHQLLLNTMAGLIDAPWTFNCSGISKGDTQQFGPTFKDCADDGFHSLPNLCIGGIKDQHACSVGTCNVIDWNGAVAAPCASNIMHFVTSQAPGMATPCCNSDDCTIPSGKYACDASRTLQLCVVDATAAQCVEPISNTICSGNFSVAVAPPSGSAGKTVSHAFPTNEPNTVTHGFPGTTATDGFAASQTPTNGLDNTAASSGGHSGLSNTEFIAIGAILGPILTACLGVFLRCRYLKRRKGNRVLTYAEDWAIDNGSVGPGSGIYRMALAGLTLCTTVKTCMTEEAAGAGIGRTSKRRPRPVYRASSVTIENGGADGRSLDLRRFASCFNGRPSCMWHCRVMELRSTGKFEELELCATVRR
ncbi:hypothetical protein B0H13DRAFT_1917802 [Mycena leptocephala]|nr:hypothetical protein B0H13DRAFT_1917802 [Mycena leptocephala]